MLVSHSKFKAVGLVWGALFFLASSLDAASYYVATTGNDTWPGSLAQPWLTIQHAANTVAAGDTVYVRAGVYNALVTINVSGSLAGGYITFQNYPGETATLDGTGLAIPNGQNGLVTIQNQNYIIIEGFEIRNYTTTTAKVPIGIYITGADSYIQILGNHVHNIITTHTPANGANALGIAVYGSSAPASINNLLIDGNELDHMQTGYSETMTINGNVQYWTVSNNLDHDNNNIGIDAIGFEGTAPFASMCGSDRCDRARDGSIVGNTVYNVTTNSNPTYGANSNAADGIYVDGGLRITIERNIVHNADYGMEITSENPGGEGYAVENAESITARNNIIYQNGAVGLSIGGYSDTGSGGGGTDSCVIVNNTLYDNDTLMTGEGELQIQYHCTNNTFKNNIVYANSQALLLNDYSNSVPVPAVMDYNLYYAPSAGSWNWNGTYYAGLASFKTNSLQDAHSSFTDPLFMNLSTPDFHLNSGSPGLGSGINLGASIVGTQDIAGNPRVQGGNIDKGAYEASSGSPTVTGTRTPSAGSPTFTSTPSRTATATCSRTATASPTPTSTASSSRTSSPTPTSTATSSATASVSPSKTATSTASSSPSRSATPSLSASPTCSETATRSGTATASSSATPSLTASVTRSPTISASASPTTTSTASSSPTRSSTPTVSGTRTGSPTLSASPSATASSTASSSRTASPTPSVSGTLTISPTATPTENQSLTATWTPTITDSWTCSPTPLDSPTLTESQTKSFTGTRTPTPSPSCTVSGTPTFTASSTKSATGSLTNSPTASSSRTVTPTLSATATDTASRTPGSSVTFTATPSRTPTVTQTQAAPITTANPGNNERGDLLQVLPLPNPNPFMLSVNLSGLVDGLACKIYTKNMVCVGEFALQGPYRAGWNQVVLPPEFDVNLGNGLYFLLVRPLQQGQPGQTRRIDKVYFIR